MSWEIVTKAEVAELSGLSENDIRTTWYDMVIGILAEESQYDGYDGTTVITDEEHDGDGTALLLVSRPPIASVASLQIDDTAMTATGYRVYNNYIKLKWDAENMLFPVFPVGVGNIKVSYTSGFSTVPADIKLAVLNAIEVIALHKQRGASTANLRYDSARDRDGAPEPGVPLASLAYTVRRIIRNAGRKKIKFR